MDTSRIDEYIHFIEAHRSIENDIIREKVETWSVILEIQEKQDSFERAITDLCLKYGDNGAKVLLMYKNKIHRCGKNISKDIDRMLRYNGEKDKPYFAVRTYKRKLWFSCNKACRLIDEIIRGFNIQPQQQSYSKNFNNTVNCTDISNSNSKDEKLSHFNDTRTDEQLCKMLKELIDLGYIANDTNEFDFIYYFSGRGKRPANRLKWSNADGKGVVLSIFINHFYYSESKRWKKAEMIFGKAKLGNAYNQSVNNNAYTKHLEIIKKIESKLNL